MIELRLDPEVVEDIGNRNALITAIPGLIKKELKRLSQAGQLELNPSMGLTIRIAHGREDMGDRLVEFLYLLARDELPLGKIEKLMSVVATPGKLQFSEPNLATWAASTADRLEAR